MKKYKKAAINIALLTLLLTVGLMNNITNLEFDQDSTSDSFKGSKNTQKKQEMVVYTLENKDYEAWKKVVGPNSRLSGLIDEYKFKRLAVARDAARNGHYNKAIKITEELKQSLKSYIQHFNATL